MDVCLVIKQRLEELGLEQRDLAAAAEVTESYISQLLTRKKMPPEPSRTDIYEKMGKFLKLPSGELAKLADHQRREVLKRNLESPPKPLFKEVRELIVRKCTPDKEKQIRAIFEMQAFGELERLVTQKLLDLVKRAAKEELESEAWLHSVAQLSGRSYEATRVSILEFLDTDAFNVSVENCVSFLDPLIESWDIDLATFGMEIVLNRRLIPKYAKKIEFVEREPAPTPLYYYRELQNLRDPLHFRESSVASMDKRRDANDVEKQVQLDSRKMAIQRWAKSKIDPRKKSKS